MGIGSEDIATFQVRLETNAIYGGPGRQEVSEQLLEQREPVIFVHQDAIVIDEEIVVRIGVLDILVDFHSHVRVAGLIHVECVICRALLIVYYLVCSFFKHPPDLINHLIDYVPVLDSDLVEVDYCLINVLVNCILKFLMH